MQSVIQSSVDHWPSIHSFALASVDLVDASNSNLDGFCEIDFAAEDRHHSIIAQQPARDDLKPS